MSIDLPSAPAATLASSATRKPSRLWIVEDHESIRELLCDFARGLPAVELIGNSRNAEPMLATAKRDGLDLVILDLLLEGSGGLQVLEQLSAVSPRPKVIVFSGMATLHTVQTAVEWGVTGYVHKSSSLEDLRQAIDRSRGEGAYFSSGPSALIRQFVQRRGAEADSPALTPRDREIVQMTAQGVHTKRIAESLSLSEPSIYKLKKSIMRKLEVNTDQELTLCALRMGLIHPDGSDRPS
jgi:DNA-binding NarL/FixJ family response regulator